MQGDPTYRSATQNLSNHTDRITASHAWCANMRSSSKSMSTACLPVRHHIDDSTRYVPVSVCCTSDYCDILSEQTPFRWQCDDANDCYLLRNQQIVQAIPTPSPSVQACVEKNQGAPGFFPFQSLATIQRDLC